MSDPINFKRDAEQQRLNALLRQYDAVNQQLITELNAANVVKLKEQLDQLEKEIRSLSKALDEPKDVNAPPSKGDEDEMPGQTEAPLIGTGKRWAVVAGIDFYEDQDTYGQLHVCANDAKTIRDQLSAGGFEKEHIRLLTDATPESLPTRDKIITALTAVAKATTPDDLLLFYYSGHGDAMDGESYLVTRTGYRVSLKHTGLSVSLVEKIMREEAQARAKVIILDSCHSGVDFDGKKGPQPMTPEFIRRVYEEAKGLAILASCEQGQLSYEWREKGCSVFTYYLKEALAGQADLLGKKFVTVDDVHAYTLDKVKEWAASRNLQQSRRSQSPTKEARVEGDIILTRYKH